MAIEDNDLLKSNEGMVVPQYFNPDADNFEPLEGGAGGFAVVAKTASFLETDVPLAGSASYTSNIRDASYYSRFLVRSFSNTGGTLSVQASVDQTDWFVVKTMPTSANQAALMEVQVVEPYYRIVYTNGASVQTQFYLSSTLKGI